MKPFHRIALAALIAAALASCGSSGAHQHEAAHDDAGHGHSAPAATPANRIAIPASVRQNLGITFAKAEYRAVEQVLRVPGRFELDAGARQEYPMPLAGAITVLVRPYDQIASGAPLYRVSGQAWAQLRAQ